MIYNISYLPFFRLFLISLEKKTRVFTRILSLSASICVASFLGVLLSTLLSF